MGCKSSKATKASKIDYKLPEQQYLLEQGTQIGEEQSTFSQKGEQAMDFGCQFAVLKTQPTISLLHTSQNGHPGPYPDSEEERVITLRKVTFARPCFWKEILFLSLTVITAGVYWLILRWYPNLMVKWRYQAVALDDETAEFALLESVDKEKEIVPIVFIHKDSYGRWTLLEKDLGAWPGNLDLVPRKMSNAPLLQNTSTPVARIINWRHIRLWYDPSSNGWCEVSFSATQGDYDYLHEVAWELSEQNTEEIRSRQHTYGKNIIQVEVAKFLSIAFQEALTPFVVFQVYSVIVWFCEEYITYSVVIVLMTASSVFYSAFQIQRSQKSLQALAKCEGGVLRASFHDNKWQKQEVWSSELVPGDLIEVTSGLVCPCDLVLLSGQCIANEAMLTGESAPVIKESLPLEGRDFNPQTNRAMKHMLLSGSSIIQTKASSQHPSKVSEKHSIWELDETSTPVLAMVLRTGCNTAKGKLIQTIQYPQDTRGFAHRQKEEAEGFVRFLFALTILAAIWFVFYAKSLGYSSGQTIIDTLDLTTILVPAALPLVLSVGVAFAFESLKTKRIYSSSTTHIVTAGHVDCICYDKTGTLTNEGDTFVGIHAIQSNNQEASFGRLIRNAQDLPPESGFSFVLAACHSLSYLVKEGEGGGELIGESLELEMYKASSWQYFSIPEQIKNAPAIVLGREVPTFCNTALLPPKAESKFLAVLKIFPFDADLRTMSTAVLALDPKTKDAGRSMILVKGAPEVIRHKCVQSSLPAQYDSFLEQLTTEGYRVLGCAFKELEGPCEQVLQEQRSALESDLTFCGFLLMGNQLKPETFGVLSQVHEVELRQCMVTGDNVLTALSVAKQCGQAFLASDNVCIVDYPDYQHGQPEVLSLSSFTVMPLSAQDISNSEMNFGSDMSSFEDVLWTIQSQPEKLSLAVSGNAFSALLDMHEVERPGELEKESTVRSRLNTLQSHLSGDGKEENETSLDLVLRAANVFARFKPHEKQMLMSVLQKRSGYYVCMVGDGANDSFALKTADIGLSICSNVITEENIGAGQEQVTAAPSIAAPFSTPTCHIGALVDLLCEGRGALACSIIAFRYMLHYGLIAFSSIVILYANNMAWSDPMWVWGDLFVNLPLAILLDMTKCGSKLVAGIPETSILSKRFAAKIFGHLAIILLTQMLAVAYVRNQEWYVSYDVGTYRMKSMEVTVVFWVATGQYITSAISLAHNYAGFRAHWWTNKPFSITTCLLVFLQSLLILCNRVTFLQKSLSTVEFPFSFCWMLIGYMVLTCLIHIIFEAMVPRKAVQKRVQVKERLKERLKHGAVEI